MGSSSDGRGDGDTGSSSGGSRFEMETIQKSKDNSVNRRKGSSED